MKLTCSVKVNLDEATNDLLQRRSYRAGCTASELLRDMICICEYGMTWGEHVAQSRRAALAGEGSLEVQRAADAVPPAASLSVVNARGGSL